MTRQSTVPPVLVTGRQPRSHRLCAAHRGPRLATRTSTTPDSARAPARRRRTAERRERELEPIVLALGTWGVRVVMPATRTTLSATSVLLFLRAAARLDPAQPSTTYRLELNRLLEDPAAVDAAVADRSVEATGDLLALRRPLRSVAERAG